MLVVRRDGVPLLARNLDEVALAVPVADLEGFEAALESLVGLEAGQPLVSAVTELASLVQRAGVAVADDLIRLLGDGRRYKFPDPRRLLHRCEHPGEQRPFERNVR